MNIKKVVLGLVVGLFVLVILGALVGGPEPEKAPKEYRFPDRPDKQETDVELVVGEFAEIEGLKVGITKAQRTTAFSEFEKAGSGKEFVIITASFENVSDKTQPYNPVYFRIQTAEGQVLDYYWFNPRDDDLESGDLVTGGKVSGTIVFEVSKEKGHQHILYKPNAWKPDRIVVQIR